MQNDACLVVAIVAALSRRRSACIADADGGRFRRLQCGRASRVKAGTAATPTTKDYMRWSRPGRTARRRLDHVGRADPHGILDPSLLGCERWDHGCRVSGDISHVHATEWILRETQHKRDAGSSTA